MNASAILFTGGSGLLGGELRHLMPGALFPSHAEFDVTDYDQMTAYVTGRSVSLVVHAAAFTSPPRINEDPQRALAVNIIGTSNIVKLCIAGNMKLIYISTDYVFKGDLGNYKESDPVLPVNKYAWSKLGGECAVRLYDKSLIIRTSFGPNDFPYEKAFVDQWTSRLTVSGFAARLVAVLDSDATGVLHIGGPRRTVYEYATTISPDKRITELSLADVEFTAPRDTSLDTSRYDSIVDGGQQGG